MNNLDVDCDLREAASRIRELGRRVPLDSDHKARLRMELLQRHRLQLAGSRGRGILGRQSRVRLLKRLSFVGLPAAAVALAASLVLWLLPISGGQMSPAAEAQRITNALARTAPTVTAWEWTLHRRVGREQRVDRLGVRLTPYQRLYVDRGRAYLYSYGQWKLLAPVRPSVKADSTEIYWQRALAGLLASLRGHDFSLLDSTMVDGRPARGIRSNLVHLDGERIAVTAWVDEKSGLILRLVRVVTDGKRLVERDVADYSYQRSG